MEIWASAASVASACDSISACRPRCRAARPYPPLAQTPVSRHRLLTGPAFWSTSSARHCSASTRTQLVFSASAWLPIIRSRQAAALPLIQHDGTFRSVMSDGLYGGSICGSISASRRLCARINPFWISTDKPLATCARCRASMFPPPRRGKRTVYKHCPRPGQRCRSRLDIVIIGQS